MSRHTVSIKYISLGSVTVEATDADDAQFKAEKLVANMHASGSILDSPRVFWQGAEAIVDGEEIDLDDMEYFDD